MIKKSHRQAGKLTMNCCFVAFPALLFALTACAQTGANDSQKNLQGRAWVVEDLAGRGIIDNSHMTLEFAADGALGGKGSCNVYSTVYEIDGNRLDTRAILTTRMSCSTALMQQEEMFLDLLLKSDTYSLTEDGALILRTKDGRTITARR